MRGPQGGKKYYHAEHGSQSNPRRRSKRSRGNGSKGITIWVDLEMDNEKDHQSGGPGNWEKVFIPQRILQQAENEEGAFELVWDYVSEETGWLVAGTDEESERKIKQAVAATQSNPSRGASRRAKARASSRRRRGGEKYPGETERYQTKKEIIDSIMDFEDFDGDGRAKAAYRRELNYFTKADLMEQYMGGGEPHWVEPY